MNWDDIEVIAEDLAASYPELDPLSVSFPRLLRMIIELEGFAGLPGAANEHRLEEIQMAWYELNEA